MTQTEQVISAMREAGGSATFKELNNLIDFSQWRTTTPEATVRRIVQESAAFFKIKPGFWALTEYRDTVINDADFVIDEDKEHYYPPVKRYDIGNSKQETSVTNTKLSYCAYFLSKFDMQAVEFLGFNTRNEAMVNISKILDKENHYLKRRRDEFDVLTGSHRKGQQNRAPVSRVLRVHQELKDFSFQELADKVQQILTVSSTIYPDDLPDNSPEYREGKKTTVQINTYERNPAARQACINHYGVTCYVCGFNFGKTYGAICEGMVHVHHLKMVCSADEEYVVNPINDLRPICPNCHMVLHSKKDGCYTIEEAKEMLERSR